MSAPTTAPNAGVLAGFRVDVSHQEIDNILTELEEIYKNQPTDWLGVNDIGQMLAHMMYEDLDEFEDAIKGSFEDFVRALPHCETKDEGGKLLFRVKPDPPLSERRHLKLTIEVRSTADLMQRVLMKAPDAAIIFPSNEFEIGADSKRAINTLYNHIAVAKQNLSIHAEQNAAHLTAEHQLRIMETCDELERMLDVEEPFVMTVDDPSGLSELKPPGDAKYEWAGEAADRGGGAGARMTLDAADPVDNFADAD